MSDETFQTVFETTCLQARLVAGVDSHIIIVVIVMYVLETKTVFLLWMLCTLVFFVIPLFHKTLHSLLPSDKHD